MKYVASYAVYAADDRLSYRSERDITSTTLRLDRLGQARRIAANLIAAQIFLGPGEYIAVDDIRPV